MENVKTEVPTAVFTIAPNAWGDKKTKLKNKFPQLNDADLHFEDGKEGELTSRLQAKLAMTEADVQTLINDL